MELCACHFVTPRLHTPPSGKNPLSLRKRPSTTHMDRLDPNLCDLCRNPIKRRQPREWLVESGAGGGGCINVTETSSYLIDLIDLHYPRATPSNSPSTLYAMRYGRPNNAQRRRGLKGPINEFLSPWEASVYSAQGEPDSGTMVLLDLGV